MSWKKTLSKLTYKKMIGGVGKGLGYAGKLAVRGTAEAASAAAKVSGKNEAAKKIKEAGVSAGEAIQKGATKVGETVGSGVQWCMEKAQDGAGVTFRRIAVASGAKEETSKKAELAARIGVGVAAGVVLGTAGTDALIHALAAPGTAGAAAITSGTAALGGGSIAAGGGGMVAGQAVAQGITAGAAAAGGVGSAATEISKETEESEKSGET
jgi:hypothetical protein